MTFGKFLEITFSLVSDRSYEQLLCHLENKKILKCCVIQ